MIGKIEQPSAWLKVCPMSVTGNKRPLPSLGGTQDSAPALPILESNKSARIESWIPGENCPSIHRGGCGDGAVGLQAHQFVSNAYHNIKLIATWHELCSALTSAGCKLEQPSEAGCVAALLGLPLKTVRGILRKDAECSTTVRKAIGHLPVSQAVSQDHLNTAGKIPCSNPGLVEQAASFLTNSGPSSGRASPSQVIRDKLAITQLNRQPGCTLNEESKLAIAVRNASLCSLLVVNCFSPEIYPKLIHIMDAHFSGALG